MLEGRGEAWLDGEEGVVPSSPGSSIALPANRLHAFRTVGDRPLVTYGVHASDKRIVNYVGAAGRRAEPFPSALRRGTFDPSRNQGDRDGHQPF